MTYVEEELDSDLLVDELDEDHCAIYVLDEDDCDSPPEMVELELDEEDDHWST